MAGNAPSGRAIVAPPASARMHGISPLLPCIRPLFRLFLLIGLGALPAPALAQQVQISELTDVAFGTIANMSSDISQSQTVCAYSNALNSNYSVRLTGSGAGGALTLSNGAATMPYDVQWNSAAGQTSGTQLVAGVPQSGFVSQGVLPGCTLGLTRSGSLTVILRAASLSAAHAGSYTGTLTVLISPN